jgi:hypothetical protein
MVVETATEKGTRDMNISKIIFVGEGCYVKVGAHNTDASKLVLKSHEPEAIKALAKAFGMQCGKTWQGSKYWITEVPKAAFLTGMAGMGKALQAATPKALSPVACVDCGAVDGAHWASCPQHPEQAN